MIRPAGLVLSCVLLAGVSQIEAQVQAQAQAQVQMPSLNGTWKAGKPLDVPRNEVALTAVGGKVYVVGGNIGGNAVPRIDEYEPLADVWKAQIGRAHV